MIPNRHLRGPRFLEGLSHVVVAGYGRSGKAAAALLRRHGVHCTVVEARAEAAAELTELPDPPPFVLQDEAGPLLAAAEAVILSPGIDLRREPFASAARRGVPILSELELGWRFAESPVVGITGSNGKSTTTALTGALLAAAGFDARVCGNIGTPLCDVLDGQTPRTIFVVEVSSFQLDTVDSFAPQVGVLLNITPDHQDRYDDLAAYTAAKERLFAFQGPDAWSVVSIDDPGAADIAARLARLAARGEGPRLIAVGKEADAFWSSLPAGSGRRSGSGLDERTSGPPDVATVESGRLLIRLGGVAHRFGDEASLPVPGPHNRDNVLAALAVTLVLGADPARLREELTTFRPLPHRLEPVGAIGGVTFVNDSKATNVDSVRMALRSFPGRRIVLIVGGKDKGADFASLVPEIGGRASLVVATGQAAPRIVAALADPLAGHGVPLITATDLAQAVHVAFDSAHPGDVVLLSPACASFDAYRNFEERGDHFRALVRALGRQGRPTEGSAHGA